MSRNITSGTLSANGDSTVHQITGSEGAANVSILVAGTFGSGTIAVHYLCNDGSYRAVTGYSYTASGFANLTLPTGSTIKLVLSGATDPTIYYEIANHKA